MESDKKSKGWGGARKGAGRKSTGAKTYAFSATPEAVAIIARVEGSKAAFINEAIRLHAVRLGMLPEAREAGGVEG